MNKLGLLPHSNVSKKLHFLCTSFRKKWYISNTMFVKKIYIKWTMMYENSWLSCMKIHDFKSNLMISWPILTWTWVLKPQTELPNCDSRISESFFNGKNEFFMKCVPQIRVKIILLKFSHKLYYIGDTIPQYLECF